MIRRILRRLPLLLWFVPGFLLWASFPPMGERMDVFFALAPILWFARHNSPGRSFRCWFMNGLFFWVATLSWMPAIVKNGGPWPLVVLGWGALAAYCALYFGVFGWLSANVWRFTRTRSYAWRLGALLLAEPILWAGLEIVRSRFGGGFAWNQLGVAPVNGGLGGPAALGGVYLVSALVVLVNGTFASIAERMLAQFFPGEDGAAGVPKWARSVETLVPLLLVLGVYRASSAEFVARRRAAEEGREVDALAVGLVQRNFPCVFKAAEEDPVDVYRSLFSVLAHAKPDILVLPESALCEFGSVDSRNAYAFAEFAQRETGARAVIAGGLRREGGKEYNSSGLYQKGAQFYDKVHLVPFGEFIPGDKWITALQKLAPVGSCTPGELKTLDLVLREGGEPVKLGVAICFEDTDSAQMRELARMGAEALVFITNDSWFSASIEAEQHAWQAVARAIETGLPVMRAGNSGVTGVVHPDGGFRWLSDASGLPVVDSRGTMCEGVAVVRRPGATPYARVGDAPIFTLFLLLITAMGMIQYTFNRRNRSLMPVTGAADAETNVEPEEKYTTEES